MARNVSCQLKAVQSSLTCYVWRPIRNQDSSTRYNNKRDHEFKILFLFLKNGVVTINTDNRRPAQPLWWYPYVCLRIASLAWKAKTFLFTVQIMEDSRQIIFCFNTEQNVKKDCSAHFLYLQSHAFPSELSWQALIEGSLTRLLFVHQLTFGLGGFSWHQ